MTYEFEWTDGYNQKHKSTRFKDVNYIFLDGSIGKQIRIPPNFRLDPTYRYADFETEFNNVMVHYDELLIEATDSDTFAHFMTLLEYYAGVSNIHRLTFKGVTFEYYRHSSSSTHLPSTGYLKFINCTFQRDTFTPSEWGTALKVIFRDTIIGDIQPDSKNYSFKNVTLEGSNDYLMFHFQFALHFPRIKELKIKNVGEFNVPTASSNITYVEKWILKGDIHPIVDENGFNTASLDEHFRKFFFDPNDPTDETDAFAYAVLENVLMRADSRVDQVSVKAHKSGQFLTLRGRTALTQAEFEIFNADGSMYDNPKKKSKTAKPGRRELEQLVGKEEGYRTIITEDPRGAPIRYARGGEAFDPAIFEADFQQHLTNPRHVHDYHTLTTFPVIFRDSVRYMHGLTEDQKRAIFLYTSGKGSRMINEVLLSRIPENELHDVQLKAMKTLIKDVFPRIPPVDEPFVVFRGYPMTTLDDGAFHSTTVRTDLLESDWYTNFDRRSLAVQPVKSEQKTGCCIHVIRVLPGARVLYFDDMWAGITAYGEFEVLFAPFMGTFHHLRTTKEKVTGAGAQDESIVYHHWIYAPTGVSVGNKRTLEDRFNQMEIRINAPHPAMSLKGAGTFIRIPSTPTGRATHTDRDAVATFVPGQKGLPSTFKTSNLTSQKLKLLVKLSAKNGVSNFDDGAAAGTIILEPDGRIWIVHPTNKFVGYTSTFPKGTRDHNEDLRTTAIRETYEETGLMVVLINYPGVCFDENDPGVHNGVFVKLDRASGLTYYYLAKRVAGSPSDMGWESQAVSLVPVSELRAQHIGKRYVTPTNWDEKPKSSDRSLTAADYLSQDEKILDYIIDQADVIQTLL